MIPGSSNTMETAGSSHSYVLPPPPEKPLDSDCCGGGCTPCILDIYQEELALWETECERLRRGENETERETNPEVSQLKPDQYTCFLIESITAETEHVLRIRCRLGRHQTLGLSMGQHIIIRCRKADGTAVTRQYTPVSPLEAKGYFELLIKLYPEGHMSQLIRKWQVGDRIEARGPHGHLKYRRNSYRRLLMLCAGTGVAPMCQVIHTLLADPEEETLLRLVYACQTYSQLIAHTELEEWKRYWNFSVLYALSQEPEEPHYPYKYGDAIVKQKIDRDLVTKELGNHINNALVLVCGTRSFDTTILGILDELGVSKDHIHHF